MISLMNPMNKWEGEIKDTGIINMGGEDAVG